MGCFEGLITQQGILLLLFGGNGYENSDSCSVPCGVRVPDPLRSSDDPEHDPLLEVERPQEKKTHEEKPEKSHKTECKLNHLHQNSSSIFGRYM